MHLRERERNVKICVWSIEGDIDRHTNRHTHKEAEIQKERKDRAIYREWERNRTKPLTFDGIIGPLKFPCRF